jgi:hypothetical protein
VGGCKGGREDRGRRRNRHMGICSGFGHRQGHVQRMVQALIAHAQSDRILPHTVHEVLECETGIVGVAAAAEEGLDERFGLAGVQEGEEVREEARAGEGDGDDRDGGLDGGGRAGFRVRIL